MHGMAVFQLMKKALHWMGILVLFFFSSCGEYEEKERVLGYKGLAKFDRFLAAQRFSSAMGKEAFSYAGSPTMPPPADVTLILPAASLQSEGQLSDISDWTSAGGHLIVYLDGGRDEFEGRNHERSTEQDYEPFLSYFGFAQERVEKRDEEDEDSSGEAVEKSYVYFRGEPYEVDFYSPYIVASTDLDDDEAGRVSSYDYGEGALTVLGSAEWFTNSSISKAEHASLLWVLLQETSSRQVWFIHSTRVSFFALLWQNASLAVVLLLALVVLFVWWGSRGFGPKFIRGTHPTARLDEHLESSGAFFVKHRASELIVDDLRESLFRRIARAMNLPFNSSREDLVAAARAKSFLDEPQIEALQAPLSDKTLFPTLQTLKHLHKKL